MATPTRLPSAFTRCTVRCRLWLPSQWTRNESEPASVNSSKKKSGTEIIRWISNGKRVTRRSDATIGTPIEMLGTKCPSMTSTWMRSAPACSASPTCLPKCAKSAERMDGASLIMLLISSIPLADHFFRRQHYPSGVGRLEYTSNRPIQLCVELGIGLLGRQSFHQGPRKARHDAVIPAQAVVGFF